ncbi:MAG TPA: hypothetical protein VL026_03090 [Rhizomicrobium sp.]|nr:hypothetical protein [Rhizomicrobium sp.]
MNNDNRKHGSPPSHGHEPAKKAPSEHQAGSGSGQPAQQAKGSPGQPHNQKMQDSPKKR